MGSRHEADYRRMEVHDLQRRPFAYGRTLVIGVHALIRSDFHLRLELYQAIGGVTALSKESKRRVGAVMKARSGAIIVENRGQLDGQLMDFSRLILSRLWVMNYTTFSCWRCVILFALIY